MSPHFCAAPLVQRPIVVPPRPPAGGGRSQKPLNTGARWGVESWRDIPAVRRHKWTTLERAGPPPPLTDRNGMQ
eukprot:9495575-Pyramimonas_sp.AAC.1